MIKKYKIPFGKPIINQKEIKLVNKVMKSSILVHGKMSLLFEKNSNNSLRLKMQFLFLHAPQVCT